eukprot:5029203-Prymnesium_polylepis.3
MVPIPSSAGHLSRRSEQIRSPPSQIEPPGVLIQAGRSCHIVHTRNCRDALAFQQCVTGRAWLPKQGGAASDGCQQKKKQHATGDHGPGTDIAAVVAARVKRIKVAGIHRPIAQLAPRTAIARLAVPVALSTRAAAAVARTPAANRLAPRHLHRCRRQAPVALLQNDRLDGRRVGTGKARLATLAGCGRCSGGCVAVVPRPTMFARRRTRCAYDPISTHDALRLPHRWLVCAFGTGSTPFAPGGRCIRPTRADVARLVPRTALAVAFAARAALRERIRAWLRALIAAALTASELDEARAAHGAQKHTLHRVQPQPERRVVRACARQVDCRFVSPTHARHIGRLADQ